MMAIGHYKKRSCQKGVAAIEFTIILPFFLLLILATSEFGRLMYQYNGLTKNVRDATRYATTKAKPGTTGQINLDAIQNDIESIVKYGYVGGSTPLLANVEQSGVLTLTPAPSVSGELITISATYNWQPIFADFIPSFFTGGDIDLNFPIRVSYTMRVIDV